MGHRNRHKKLPKHKKKKRKMAISAGTAVLLRRLRDTNPSLPQKVLIDPPDHEKMSAVILEFARPLLDFAKDDATYRNVISFAIVAWNFAVIREQSGPEALEEIMQETAKPGSDKAIIESYRPFLEALFQRKRELFPDNHRMILDYKLNQTRDNLNLNVLSYMA